MEISQAEIQKDKKNKNKNKDKDKKKKDKAENKAVETKGKKLIDDIKITTENKCSFCAGSKCCTYTGQEIDAPRTMADFDQLLWQLAHERMQAYKDEDGWHLSILNPCMHLQPSGACGIYEQRPMICREYTNDYCEYDQSAEDDFELFFSGYHDLDAYCRKRFKNWDRRFEKWAKK